MAHSVLSTRHALLRRFMGTSALVFASCAAGEAAPAPTPTPERRPTPSPYQVEVRMHPQEAKYGKDEHVVIQARFTRNRRGVSGAQLSATAHYPGGPQTFRSEITTFPDGRVDLAIPVEPAKPGSTVPVEVIMTYRGEAYRAKSGFSVR